MRWWKLCITLALVHAVPHFCTRGTKKLMSKQETHVIRKNVNIGPNNVLYVHNSRGSVYARSDNIKQPHIEAHIYGPEGFTENVTISQASNDKKWVQAELQNIEQQEDETKKKKQPTLADFSIDYYVTVPPQAGISITSDDTLYVSLNGIKGHIGIEGTTIMSYVYNAGKSVSVDVNKGDVTLDTARGYTDIHTRSGSALISNIHGDVNASSHGTMTIKNIRGNAFINNQRGHMYITDISEVLNAQSRDSITVTQHTFTENTNIFLNARNTVNLYVPQKANANIYAKTVKGIVTSDIPITLDPITTRLSKEIWKYMQKHVKGAIGSGGAHMNIDAGGHIHIYEASQ